jgi:hypothetical protein
VAEALDEHREAKTLLNELEELGVESPDFGAKLEELIDAVEHPVEEEDQNCFHKYGKFSTKTNSSN